MAEICSTVLPELIVSVSGSLAMQGEAPVTERSLLLRATLASCGIGLSCGRAFEVPMCLYMTSGSMQNR